MLTSKQNIFITIGFVSIFFILLIVIIIITAIQYHNRKRKHVNDLSNFQNILMQAQMEIQEHTLQTVGTDLHDNIGQLLSLTSVTLRSIDAADVNKTREKVDTAVDLTLRSIKELRSLGKLIQGGQLIESGLPEALRQEVNWIEKTGSYQISFSEEGEYPAVNNSDKDLIIFRIFQEVANNIIKHSNASQVEISLVYINGVLKLQITDNGIGFETDSLAINKKGLGLHNISRRAEAISGKAIITSALQRGTSVIIQIPYP